MHIGYLQPMKDSFWEYSHAYWLPMIFLTFLYLEKILKNRYTSFEETRLILKASTISVIVSFGVVTMGRLSSEIPRSLIIFLGFYCAIFFSITHFLVRRLLYRFQMGVIPVLVIGMDEDIINTMKFIIREKNLGYRFIGFLDNNFKTDSLSVAGQRIPYLGKADNHRAIQKKSRPTITMISLQSNDHEKNLSRLSQIRKYSDKIVIIPDLKGIALANSQLIHLFNERMFLIQIENELNSSKNKILKRSFDLFFSILSIPIIAPLLIVISIIIKLTSPGPVFFVQERLGKNFRLFRCLKFRTMRVNSDELLKEYFLRNPDKKEEWDRFRKIKGEDPRVTRFGRILRATSLDELPQVINILSGSMSFVGPRPYISQEVENEHESMQQILSVRPGITGLWQVSGRNSLSFKDRLDYDIWYIQNWSLWLDFTILLRTISVVLQRKDVY